jgi:iron complex outermembrane receptor protein
LEEVLDRVPGVLAQSSQNFAQDVRIQIRGFGTRSAFGIREIKVLLDGIPITGPDGQTELDDIDLGAMRRIEVLRGPAGALYGNASGGVIQFFTEDAPEVPTQEVILTGGSYGLGKYEVKGGARTERAQLFFTGSYLQLDGYRDHSATQSGNLTGTARYQLTDSTDVTVLFTGVDSPLAQDPGALTQQQVDQNPRQARNLNVQLDAGEAVQQARLATLVHQGGEWSDLWAYAYGVYRDFDSNQPIPPPTPSMDMQPPNGASAGVVTFTRNSPGCGVRGEYHRPLFGLKQSLSSGFDFQYQDDNRHRSLNENGSRGALALHQSEGVTAVGPWIREAVYLRDDLEISAGARYDWLRFNVDVHYPPHSGESDSRVMDAWSPAGGIRWTPQWGLDRPVWAPDLSLYFNVGTAFQSPTTTELTNPNAPGFNPDISPQTSITYELGARAEHLPRLSSGVAAYLIDVSNELVPFESPSGRTAFRNAGSSQRLGLELNWDAALLPPLRWSGAVTLLDAKYTQFKLNGQSLAGNDEPGIPSWWIYQELEYRHAIGFFAAVEAFLVDGYAVNDQNTASTSSYELVNLRGGYEHSFGDHWTFGTFVGFGNLTDANYIGTVRINALAGRYFEPAPEFNVYGGIGVIARL